MMRCLTRNKTPFYYARHDKQDEIKDEYGNATGQYKVLYTEPIKVSGNISAARGEIQSRQFGESEIYDKVIVLDDPNIPIDEYSILWVDNQPSLDSNGHLTLNEKGEVITPHDYIVKKVARSLNNVSIAISKVFVK
jgi:hypothetical protein